MSNVEFAVLTKDERMLILVSKYGDCKFFDVRDYSVIKTVDLISK